MNKKWTEEDIEYLEDNYKQLSTSEMSCKLKRTIDAVNRRLFILDLKKHKRWSKEDVEYLKDNYTFKSNKELSITLNRNEISVYNKSKKLNLYKDKEFLNEYLTMVNKENRRDLNYDSVKEIASKFKTKRSFEINDGGAYTWCVKNNYIEDICSHMIPQRYSTPQLICKYIFDILVGEECQYNTKKIIKPYELDLYYPNHKLAIEYNGKHWHSKDDNTKLKTKMCNEKGIKLLVFHEDSIHYESDIKKDIIKILKRINNILNKNIKKEDIENIIISGDIFNSVLDINDIITITTEYKIYSEFYKENTNLAKKLMRMGIIDKYTSHMFKNKQKSWNIEMVINEIELYDNINDLRTKSHGCYEYIRRNDLQYLLVEREYKTRFDKLYTYKL